MSDQNQVEKVRPGVSFASYDASLNSSRWSLPGFTRGSRLVYNTIYELEVIVSLDGMQCDAYETLKRLEFAWTAPTAITWKLRMETGREYVNHRVKDLAGKRSYFLVTRLWQPTNRIRDSQLNGMP